MGVLPLYEELTKGVAADPEVLALLDEPPPDNRQPNLLLATVRYLVESQPDYSAFRTAGLEVGASAGLFLLPDRYDYDYDGHLLHGSSGAPVFTCQPRGTGPRLAHRRRRRWSSSTPSSSPTFPNTAEPSSPPRSPSSMRSGYPTKPRVCRPAQPPTRAIRRTRGAPVRGRFCRYR